jgi:hypothetical protein
MIRSLGIAIVFALFALPVAAQSTELGGTAGFTPSVSLERQAREVDDVTIDGGLTFGISATRFISEHWGFGFEWSQHFSGFGIQSRDERVTLYGIDISDFQGFAVYRFGAADSKVRPFAFGGAGMRLFSARDLDSESKLSFGLGGGLTYFMNNAIGFEGRFTYRPTMMGDPDAVTFCDPFDYCQSSLHQFELAGGVRVRF